MEQARRRDAGLARAVAFTVAAGALVAAGAASLSDAADGWQNVLNITLQLSRNPRCKWSLIVSGWGDSAVLALAILALALVGLTGWAVFSIRRWGELTAALALVPVCIVWLDAYAVSQAPSTDCEAMGLGGPAGVAIARAGWCFFGASILCCISCAWLVLTLKNASPEARNSAADGYSACRLD